MHHDDFWKMWAEVGKELIDHCEEVQFGHSLLEIKYMEGQPKVIILSKSIKKKYPTDEIAKLSVAQEMETTEKNNFTGARTFTLTYNKGHISHILLDEYTNKLL